MFLTLRPADIILSVVAESDLSPFLTSVFLSFPLLSFPCLPSPLLASTLLSFLPLTYSLLSSPPDSMGEEYYIRGATWIPSFVVVVSVTFAVHFDVVCVFTCLESLLPSPAPT